MMNGVGYFHDIKYNIILISHDFRAVLLDFTALDETKEPVDRYVLPKYDCIGWLYDMMNGVEYLPDLRVYHPEIKCNNILISYDFRSALRDFTGLAETKEPVDQHVLPKKYCFPEPW